jgi:hypothetical protein
MNWSHRPALWRLALTLGLFLTVFVAPAGAQDQFGAAGGEAETGEPLYGYLGTAALAGAAMFALAKSARR